MSVSVELISVLQESGAYYRPWQQGFASLGPAQRAALNHALMLREGLSGWTMPAPASAPIVDRLVSDWARVPRAAYLMACARQRPTLLASRLLLDLPSAAIGFMRMGFEPAPAGFAITSHVQLLGWGGADLQRDLAPYVPAWLHQRLGLWFSGLQVPDVRAAPPHADARTDLTCFWSAWHHAVQLSRVPA